MSRNLTNDEAILLGQLAAAKWELSQAEIQGCLGAINIWARLVQKKKESLILSMGLEEFKELAEKRKLAV